MNRSEFYVTRFENRNGVISWRVAGWLHGVRIRKNFKTRDEAAAEKAALEIKALQTDSGLRPQTTFLTAEQLRESESLFQRISGRPQTLSFYVDYALAHYRPASQETSLTDASTAYLAIKNQEHARTLISARQLRAIRNEMTTFQERFPHELVSRFNPETITAYLERGAPALKTYNNRRGLLFTFFKFAVRKGWTVENPVERTVQHRIAHRRGSAETLTTEQAAELLSYAEKYKGGVMVPYFVLCLFAGVRPCLVDGEILRLDARDVCLDLGVIRIEPEVSKIRTSRQIAIQSNLAAWLRAYPLSRFPIVPPNAKNMRAAISRQFGLTHDVLRHTFISMFVGKFRSMGEAALQAGNSESIIRKHYLNVKSKKESDRFFNIGPKRNAEPTIPTEADIIQLPPANAAVA